MPNVWVVWEFDYDEPVTKEYRFDTDTELDAFVLGVTEADPTHEYHTFCASEEKAKEYLEETDREQSEDD